MSNNFLPALKKGLSRTRSVFTDRLTNLFVLSGKPSKQQIDEIEEALISADISYPIVERIISDINSASPTEIKNIGGLKSFLKYRLLAELQTEKPLEIEEIVKPKVIMLVGVNGSGKTTTVGKLAFHFRSRGKSVILAAADTYRDAAIDQLGIWGQRSGFRVISHKPGSDASAVIFDAIKAVKARDIDYLLIDTAGRLHTKYNLMQELEKMQRITGREIEGAPHEIYLVLDANTGQNGIAQAEEFLKSVRITGLIIAKMDGTARAGFIFGIKEKTGIDVEYLGTGENANDLVPFDSEQFVNALLLE